MAPDPKPPATAKSQPDTVLRRLLGGMSIFTLFMTVPQILTIWVGHQAAGVSVLSWSAYLLSAVLWFWFGLQQGDKNIYLPCVGWVILDSAVIAGRSSMGSCEDSAPISGRTFGDLGNYEMAEKYGQALLGKGYGVKGNLRAADETRHAMRHVTYVKCDGTDSACGWLSMSIPGCSKGSSSNESGNRRWQEPHCAKRASPANHSIPCHRC